MADRIESFDVTFPSGTAKASPVTIATTFADGVVVALEVDVPPGPSGLMGFAFQHSAQQIIPRTSGKWIVLQDVHLNWPLENYPIGGTWAVVGYNTDIYAHTIQVRFLVNELAAPVAPPVSLVPIVP